MDSRNGHPPAQGDDEDDDDELRLPRAGPSHFPLIPHELLEHSLKHSGPVRTRKKDTHSLLRHYSRPGHLHGEGIRRIFIGSHPEEAENNVDLGGRSFLIGIDALWAEEAIARRLSKASSSQPAPNNVLDRPQQTIALGNDVERMESEAQAGTSDDEEDISGSSDSSSDSEYEDATPGYGDGRSKNARSRATSGSTDPNVLFDKLRSNDDKKELSDSTQVANGHAKPQADILSRRMQDSPAGTESSLRAAAGTEYFSIVADGKRDISKPLKNTTRNMAMASPQLGQTEPSRSAHNLRHELLRRPSETLLDDTASDTAMLTQRQKRPEQLKATKSVRWEVTRKEGPVPVAKKEDSVSKGASIISGDKPAAAPETVLARPDPVEAVQDGFHTGSALKRSNTSESIRMLTQLGVEKENALPPGIEKMERMLVRFGWTPREDLPDDFDEMAARKFAIRYKRWEEMAVVWKRNRLELWGSYVDPFRRFLTKQLQLKDVIRLTANRTNLSLFTISDQVFALTCTLDHHDFRRRQPKRGKFGKKNRDEASGTFIFLVRARAPSVAEDWYLGLHIALGKPRIHSLEIHLSELELRMQLPTARAAHSDVSSTIAIAAARQLISGGQDDEELVAKEEMLQTVQQLLGKRQDWAELLQMLHDSEIKLAFAWRKGQIIEWLTLERSVDGLRRVWDLYTGAVMRQNAQAIHQLEIAPQTHYPTYAEVSHNCYMVEPPAIEGYISRLRQRNELKREKMYISTHAGFLVLCKLQRAYPPAYPNLQRWVAHGRNTQGQAMKAFMTQEDERIRNQLARCKGLLRLRDIDKIELCDCNQASQQGESLDRKIIQVDTSDGRRIRFELTPPEANVEWASRLRALVAYWTKREQQDARDAVLLNGHAPRSPIRNAMIPAFQAREMENTAMSTNEGSPLLMQAFHFCVIDGCRQNVLKQGRLYYKMGHREDAFVDRFFVLVHDQLVEFEVYRRNIGKRPIPLAHHRRVNTIRLRDVYLITSENCSDFLGRTGQSTFDPSTDQSTFARVYQDGLVSVDDPMDCTFALWRQRRSGQGTGLGRKGQAFVFQARSRLERDQWAQALNVACERIARTHREREVKLATFSTIK